MTLLFSFVPISFGLGLPVCWLIRSSSTRSPFRRQPERCSNTASWITAALLAVAAGAMAVSRYL